MLGPRRATPCAAGFSLNPPAGSQLQPHLSCASEVCHTHLSTLSKMSHLLASPPPFPGGTCLYSV